jgi:TonB family protein
MGKIVKYCNSCDESFAEKFGFCPNCGKSLEAFEMNPLERAAEAAPVPEAPAFIETAPEIAAAAPVEEPPIAVDEPGIEASAAETEEYKATEPEAVEATEPETETVIKSTPIFVHSAAVDVDTPVSFEAEHEKAIAEGGYYLTVIEEKNGKQRNSLLAATFVLMTCVVIFGVAYSIFSRDLEVAAINENYFNALLVDEVPMPVEEQPKQNKDKSAGGGGGSGRQEDETTQGDLANQTEHPERPPQALDRHNFDLQPPPASTQGNMTFPQTHDRFGDPNGRFTNWNNGAGTGNGQGNGNGTGQGNGRGTGAGNGNGSGYGNGDGNGNGNGSGSGDDERGSPPPAHVGVTKGLSIVSKPKAMYTDQARQNNYQGSVLLRVTFLASGQIGGISAVRGGPYGTTESAIAAARRIVFQPAMQNGQPVTISKTVEYSFTMY